MNATIHGKICGDTNPQRYTLIKVETNSVYGSGRPGWGIKFQSDASRRLISDHTEWFESSAAARDDAFAVLAAGGAL